MEIIIVNVKNSKFQGRVKRWIWENLEIKENKVKKRLMKIEDSLGGLITNQYMFHKMKLKEKQKGDHHRNNTK